MQRVWLIQLPAASVLQRRNSRYRLSGNFESVCSRRGIHGPITFAYYYADYTVTRISSLSRLHLEQLAPSTLSPAPSYRLRRQEKKTKRDGGHDEDTGALRHQYPKFLRFLIERLLERFLRGASGFLMVMGWCRGGEEVEI